MSCALFSINPLNFVGRKKVLTYTNETILNINKMIVVIIIRFFMGRIIYHIYILSKLIDNNSYLTFDIMDIKLMPHLNCKDKGSHIDIYTNNKRRFICAIKEKIQKI
jgi:hypothetical protein